MKEDTVMKLEYVADRKSSRCHPGLWIVIRLIIHYCISYRVMTYTTDRRGGDESLWGGYRRPGILPIGLHHKKGVRKVSMGSGGE